MYYYAGNSLLLGHYTYINNQRVLESVANVISASKKYNTKFHGGVFHLRANDQISVRPMFVKEYRLDSAGSYFGAFMLYSTNTGN